MKIKIQIREIDFGDVILKVMPLLQEKAPKDASAISKIIATVTQLPSDVIRTMLNAVSQEDKSEIVALLVRDNKEKIMNLLSQLLKQNDIDVSLDGMSVNEKLELCVTVSNFNYAALAAKYLPLVRNSLIIDENPALAMLSTLLKLPGILLYSALEKIPQDKKDESVAYLVNRNEDRIIAKIEEMLIKQDMHVRLDDLRVEV